VRHAGAIPELLLSATVVPAALIRRLVLAASFAIAGLIAQLAALSLWAVAVPPIVPEADLERLAALKAGNLDEIDRTGTRHAAGEADLDNERREWEACPSRGRAFASLRRLPGRSSEAAGRFRLSRRRAYPPRSPSPRLRRGL